MAEKPLGEKVVIHGSAIVHGSRMGPFTEIGARSQFLESHLGAYSYVQNDCTIIHTSIGKFVSIAPMVRLNAVAHPTHRASQHAFTYRSSRYGFGPDDGDVLNERRDTRVTIGHDVWIGHGAILMPGVTIGTGAVIGAGAIVTRDVAAYQIAVGNPARPLRARFTPAIQQALLDIAWWDWPHDKLQHCLRDFRSLPIEAFVEKHGVAIAQDQQGITAGKPAEIIPQP